ncbi:hypothetical protein DICPUDRAFT_147534 [Dictyostelium purpureum]|uniref:Ketosynthase family 3 (KS3) domain-containing protein n=1 Tax=Dictyostelium purpureum TaxID=5786 RepID=F0Z8R1_DICPU|nr:uncharacterized protein DICPUDRAFT_147534 [Dictyostelium purpureum]EGC39674.1 hypothetical protein DICPUDRAFT_147534 [Dictyostelium purpureum]|eukprot:XP_003283783.1 hypothetical protein DICPUDRAFT_147534 [Dictyostelium purpureum]
MNGIESYNEKVAIVGVGFRLPSGYTENGDIGPGLKDCGVLWDSLMKGFDGIVHTNERWSCNYHELGNIASHKAGLLPLKEWGMFDPLLFGINPNDSSVIDPQQRLLLKVTMEALEDAQIDPLSLRGSDTCVHIGSSATDYQNTNKEEIKKNIFGFTPNSIANRISFSFDLHGESITLDTACSSSLNALYQGYNAIKLGNSKISISGGVNMINYPLISESFTNLNMLVKIF